MKIERLRLVKVKEEARARQQLSGAAHLHDAALVDHENPVCVQDCGQAVGHGNSCQSARALSMAARTFWSVQGIEGSGCVVQQEEPGALQQGPRNGKTLAFPSGERQALLPHDRMVAVRQARDELRKDNTNQLVEGSHFGLDAPMICEPFAPTLLLIRFGIKRSDCA